MALKYFKWMSSLPFEWLFIKEVYVSNPFDLKIQKFPNHVFKLQKALHSFRQVPQKHDMNALVNFSWKMNLQEGRLIKLYLVK